jgi:hypothetical protein
MERMIASQSAEILAAAIPAAAEEAVDVSIHTPLKGYAAMAKTLVRAGDDILRLASAMEVLARRGARVGS